MTLSITLSVPVQILSGTGMGIVAAAATRAVSVPVFREMGRRQLIRHHPCRPPRSSDVTAPRVVPSEKCRGRFYPAPVR